MDQDLKRRLQGRAAVVTGGAQGIGFAIAARLTAEGAAVVLADIKFDTARAAAERINADGGNASALAVDIGDDASVAALAAAVDELHGRCEILVNNAAIQDTTGIAKPVDGALSRRHPRQPGRRHPHDAGIPAAAQEGRGGPAHPQHRFDHGPARQARCHPLFDRQGRDREFHPGARLRSREGRDHGQRDRAGVRRHADVDPARRLA